MIFKTQSLGLATYLMLRKVPYLGLETDPGNSKVILASFDDSQNMCKTLEIEFVSSEFAKFRDLHKWLLGQVHKELKRTQKHTQ